MSSQAATGEPGLAASAVKPGGGSKTVSRWLIQHCCSAGSPASSRAAVAEQRQLGAAELALLGALDAAAERRGPSPACRNRCRAPGCRARAARGAAPGRPRLVDRGRAAGEDERARLALPDPLDVGVVREQLGEDAALADPPRDQLRVLAAEVEDQHLLAIGGSSTGATVCGLRGRRASPSVARTP